MPSLLDAADVFSNLRKQLVEIDEAACVRVRHRHASCHACLQVCTHEAITIDNNTLSVDNALCTGCGACATVCPTAALKLVDGPELELEAAIEKAGAHGEVRIACERIPEKRSKPAREDEHDEASREKSLPGTEWAKEAARQADAPDTPCEVFVGCLACIDESTIVHAACSGVSLYYRSADCTHCPNANAALIEEVIEGAARLLKALQLPREIPPLTWKTIDDGASNEGRDRSPEMSRRGMFDHLVARTTNSIADAAVGSFYLSQHTSEERPTLAQSLMESHGRLKRVSVERNARVLDDLYRCVPDPIGSSPTDPHPTRAASDDELIPTRLFGEIALDIDRCDLCGICMTFCPTAALSGIPNPPANPFVATTREVAISGELSFRANDCVACGLCRDICPRDAISLRRGIAQSDLFALEPTVLFAR